MGYVERVSIMRDRKQISEIMLAELSVSAIMDAIASVVIVGALQKGLTVLWEHHQNSPGRCMTGNS